MEIDDLPEVDLDLEDLPTVDLDAPQVKPRPVAKKRPQKKSVVQPTPPTKFPYGIQMKDVVDSIMGKDRRSQVKEATTAYEAGFLKEPPAPHKFVPKKGPPIRDLGAEQAQFEQNLKAAETRIDREKYEAKLAGRTAPGTAEQLLNRFGRGYVGSMSSMLKGPTLLNPNASTDPVTKFLYLSPEEKRSQLQTLLPVNEYDTSFKMKAAEAIGSTVPFLIGGAAAEATGLPAWMMSGVLGASSNAAQTYDEAIASGTDELTARKAAISGALIGMTEALGLGNMHVPEGNMAAFATPLMKRMLDAGKEFGQEGLEELIQEFGSQVLNNVNAKVVSGYDPRRAIQEGVWEAGSMGFLTGGLMAGGMRGITGTLNAADPDYRAAKKEYAQALAIDQAFKKFMEEERVADAFAKANGMPARIPPPPGMTRGVPKGVALESGPMAPLADMALMSQETPVTPEERQANLDKFLENSQVKRPVYHGTQTPTEILQVDPNKFDPEALYGPGFYTTQSSDVAAGEGGYADSKKAIVSSETVWNSPEYKNFFAEEMAKQREIPGYALRDPDTVEGLAMEKAYERAFASLRTGNPHAYKVYLDIRKPFDIDAPVDPDIQLKFRDDFGFFPRGYDGEQLYDALVEAVGDDKAAANQWLQEQGYDGITHIGGGRRARLGVDSEKAFETEEEARAYAEQVGGKLIPPQPESEYFPGVRFPYGDKWQVEGHKVWIAFKPEQVKSATGNVGTFDPTRPEIYRSQTGAATAPDISDDPMAFDVIPPLGGPTGNAPYMMMPRWAMAAIGEPSTTGGINIPYTELGTTLKKLRRNAPTEKDAEEATKALFELAEHTVDQGLNSLSLIPRDQPAEKLHGAAQHEVFHAVMRAGLIPKLNWIKNHPLLTEVLNRPIVKETPKGNKIELPSVRDTYLSDRKGDDALIALAMEIPAYTIQGRLDVLGMTSGEGLDFLFDLYNHLRTEYGQEGIDKLKNLTRLRPEMAEALDLAQSMWETWQQELSSPDGILDPDDVVIDEMQPFHLGDRVVVDGQPEAGVLRVIHQDENSAVVRGPRGIANMAKKGLKKVANWINTKAGKKTLEDNPLTPDLPENTAPPAPPAPPNTPPPPGGEGGPEGPFGPLYKQHVSPEATRLITRTFRSMLEAGGIDVDPVQPPFLQVIKALQEGKLQNVDIEEILDKEGIPWETFTEEMEKTASDAGKVLQSYSEIARFWNTIIDEWEISEGIEKPSGGRTGPRLPGDMTAMLRLVPMDVRVRRALKGVRNTALAKNWWQRSGSATQKAMLTQLSTFITNTMTTLGGQLPLRVVTYGPAAWFYQMIEGKGSFMQRLQNAHQEGLDSMKVSLEVLMSMNPRQLAEMAFSPNGFMKGTGREFARYQNIVYQLEQNFPDIHKKLFALSSGTETLKKGHRQLQVAHALAARVTDKAKREKLLKEMEVYDRRLRQNVSALGQVFNKGEALYDAFLQPMQFAEFFLRRPMFVGQLNLELKREGLDLNRLLAANALDTIPPMAMERAVNKALEFTYAYMPGGDAGSNYVIERQLEKLAAYMIEGMNKWGGPLNALIGEPFLKASFNGAKFVYEYSPLGMLLPAARILTNKVRVPKVARINSQVRFGNIAASAKQVGDTITDPVTLQKTIIHPTTYEDYDRMMKGVLGMIMYGTVYFLKHAYGGPEWWQIDKGDKDTDGRPIYYDIRRLKPFSALFQAEDLVERLVTGKMGDMNALDVAGEVLSGIRLFDNQVGGGAIAAMSDYLRGEDSDAKWDIVQEQVGKDLAVYITPLINFRDLIAQFVEDENVKKDTRGSYSVLGPVMEKIPFLRQKLPNLTSPVEPSPIELSHSPAMAQLVGQKTVVGENFAGREWRRLGLFNRSFLPRDPDPIINRAQNEAFQNAVGQLGSQFEKDPAYQKATDDQKAAWWELFIGGDNGLAAGAREIGSLANPKEAMKRSLKEGSGMGRFMRKSSGFDKAVEKALEK
jgi:hypothetical protein